MIKNFVDLGVLKRDRKVFCMRPVPKVLLVGSRNEKLWFSGKKVFQQELSQKSPNAVLNCILLQEYNDKKTCVEHLPKMTKNLSGPLKRN